MRKNRFIEEQTIEILKEHAAALSAGEVYRVSEHEKITIPMACSTRLLRV